MSDKLLMRRLQGDGTLVLLARRDPASNWIEAYRAKDQDSAALAEMDRKQSLFGNPLVREIFLDLMEDEPECFDLQVQAARKHLISAEGG